MHMREHSCTGYCPTQLYARNSAILNVNSGNIGMAHSWHTQAADIVLLDDNFASITRAIEMGRLVFDNLKKTVAYTLTHAIPELVPIGIALAFFIPLAFPGLLILTVDLITEQVRRRIIASI